VQTHATTTHSTNNITTVTFIIFRGTSLYIEIKYAHAMHVMADPAMANPAPPLFAQSCVSGGIDAKSSMTEHTARL